MRAIAVLIVSICHATEGHRKPRPASHRSHGLLASGANCRTARLMPVNRLGGRRRTAIASGISLHFHVGLAGMLGEFQVGDLTAVSLKHAASTLQSISVAWTIVR